MSADKAARLAAIRAANARKAAEPAAQEPTAPQAASPNDTSPPDSIAPPARVSARWLRAALRGLGALAFLAVAGLLLSAVLGIWQPILAYGLPDLAPSLQGMWQLFASTVLAIQAPAYLSISRATALVSYGLLWLSMALGLAITARTVRLWPGGPPVLDLHQHLSLLGLLFAIAHVASLLPNPLLGYTAATALLPWLGSSYRPFWVGLMGKAALYLMLIVWLSFYIRKWISARWWRRLHYMSFAVFLLSLAHGIFAGSDTATAWAEALYGASGAVLLALLVYRIVRTRRVQASDVAMLQLDALKLDPITRTVQLGTGRRTTLPPSEARLLYFLMQNAGQVLSHEHLLDKVWGRQYRGKRHMVASAIQRLRTKIEPNPAAPVYIHSLPEHGYRFGTQPPLVMP